MTYRHFHRSINRLSVALALLRASASLALLASVLATSSAVGQTVSVTPDGATTTVAPLTKLTYNFTVQNTGGTLTAYSLAARCMPPLSSCSITTAAPITLAGGASTTVTVAYRSGPGSATGTLALTATSPSAVDSGTVSVTSSANPSSGYLVTDTTIHNYANHRVELCEAGCFTTRFSLSTVPYVSGDRPRSVTLAYNGDAVAARPIVSVDVSLSAGGPTLQEYWLEAKDSTNSAITFVNGDTKLRFAPPSPQTTKVRLSGQFDAAAYQTGVYPITLVVTAKYSGSTDSQTIPTRFFVINGRREFGNASANSAKNPGEVARGWYWVEYARAFVLGADVAIVDGSGSATFYTGCGTNCWVSPAGDFTRLTYDVASTHLVRTFPDSSREMFQDGLGRIHWRISRTNDTVTFNVLSAGGVSGTDPLRKQISNSNTAAETKIFAGQSSDSTTRLKGVREFQENVGQGRTTYFYVSETDSTLTEWRDPDNDAPTFGPPSKLVYDASKRLSKVISRRGDTTTFTYDAVTWKLASVVSSRFAVDPRLYGAGQTRQLTTTYRPWQTASVPTTSTVSTLWTPALSDTLRGAVTDAGGHVTAFTSNRWGQAMATTELPGSGLARTTTVYRDAYSPLADSVRHHEGGLDEFQYSGPLMTYQKLAGQNAVNTAYTKFAQPDSIWGTGVPKQVFYLGSRGRVDSVATVAGADSFRTRYTYDSRFRVTSVKDPAAHVTNIYYNSRHGNVDSTKAPGGRRSERRFDWFGRDTASREATLPWRKTIYDTLSRPLKQITAASSNPDTTIFTYDSLNLRQVRDAESNTYDFTYNSLGGVTQRTDPAGNNDKYFFNDEGLLTTWVNRRGDTLKTTYDDLHRRLTKSGQVAVADSFSYAASGRILSAWNQNARDSVFADSSGWLDSVVTRLSTDPTKRFRVQYRKTAVGQLDSVNVATNTPIVFTGRKYFWNSGKGTLDSVSLNGQATVFGRNSELLRSSVAFPVGVTRTESTLSIHNEFRSAYNVTGVDTLLWRNTAFDTVGRVAQYHAYFLSSKDRAKFSYVYDEQGRVKKWIDSTLTYQNNCPPNTDPDFGGFLCAGYVGSLVFLDTLSYDRVGNITYSHGLPGTGSATYDKNRITAWPGYTFAHDSAGNVISRTPTGGPTTYFHWSADGLLDSVIVGTRKLQYDYNAFGQLVRKRLNGTPVAHFHWDQGHLLAETDGSDTLRIAEYAYLPGVDQPLAIVTGATSIAKTSYLQQDPLGNVIGGVSNGPSVDGSIVIVDPWGFHYGPATSGLATSDTNRLRFQGLIYEGDSTQMYYVRSRWYDPRTHRFMTQDPVDLEGGVNLYSFGLNDPVNHSDPLGFQSCSHYARKEGTCAQNLPGVDIQAEGGGGWSPGNHGRPWATTPMNGGGGGSTVRPGQKAPRNPSKPLVCRPPGGPELQLSFGPSASIGLGLPGGFITGSLVGGVTSEGTVFGSFGVSLVAGAGAYLGAGTSLGGGVTNVPMQTGTSGDLYGVAEAQAGLGPSAGGSVWVNKNGGNVSRALKLGVGYGGYAGVGIGYSGTAALNLPWLRRMFGGC